MTSRAPEPTLIVEDEPHARHYLREMLAGENRLVIVGEASNGSEGIEMVRALSPAVVFLDVQMPEFDGFTLVQAIGGASMPVFIFVTAYSEHAVRAFEVDAADYLCKPFDRDRLLTSVDRALRHLNLRRSHCAPPAPVAAATPSDHWLSRVAVKSDDGILFVPVEEILWIEAANKYVVIHTAGKSHVARQTIRSLEDALDPKQFVRIHRSILVRKAEVRALYPLFHGDYMVKLANGEELTLSRNFRESFFRHMSW